MDGQGISVEIIMKGNFMTGIHLGSCVPTFWNALDYVLELVPHSSYTGVQIATLETIMEHPAGRPIAVVTVEIVPLLYMYSAAQWLPVLLGSTGSRASRVLGVPPILTLPHRARHLPPAPATPGSQAQTAGRARHVSVAPTRTTPGARRVLCVPPILTLPHRARPLPPAPATPDTQGPTVGPAPRVG